MFNAVSKTSFTVAVVALFAAIGTAITIADRVGLTVLAWIAVTATLIGLASFWYTPRDPVVPVSPEVEDAASRTIDVTDLPTGSPWPMVAAVAVALGGIAAALGTSIVVLALVAGTVATFAWLGQVWREHPSWTQEMTDRLNNRFVVPIGLPGTVIVFAGIGVLSLSRVFLTVSVEAAPLIAAAVGFAVLGAFWLVSTRPNLGRSALAGLVATSSVLVVGVGVASALRGEREFHHAGAEGEHGGTESFVLVTDDFAFDKETVQLPASSQITLELENVDVAPHNWSLYTEEDGDAIYQSPNVDAGETESFEFTTPEGGTYFFRCDLHPQQMKGTAEVAIDASEAGHEGDNATTTSTTEP